MAGPTGSRCWTVKANRWAAGARRVRDQASSICHTRSAWTRTGPSMWRRSPGSGCRSSSPADGAVARMLALLLVHIYFPACLDDNGIALLDRTPVFSIDGDSPVLDCDRDSVHDHLGAPLTNGDLVSGHSPSITSDHVAIALNGGVEFSCRLARIAAGQRQARTAEKDRTHQREESLHRSTSLHDEEKLPRQSG